MLRWSPCTCQRLAAEGALTTTVEIVACERLARLRQEAVRPEGAEEATKGLRYHLTVPLRSPSGRLFGLLNLARPNADLLDALTRQFLDLVGELLASAAERAELIEERAKATELAHALVGQQRVAEVAETLFAALEPVLAPDALSLLLVDPSVQFLVLRAGRGWSASVVDQLWLPLEPPTHNSPAWALAVGRPVTFRLDQPDRPFYVPLQVIQAGVRVSTFFPLFAAGRPVGVIVANYLTEREVDERRLRFAALLAEIGAVALARASEHEQNEALLHELPIGVYRLDARGTVLQANQAFARLLGRERGDEVAGSSIATLFADPTEGEQFLHAIHSSAGAAVLETLWMKPAGGSFWVRLTAHAQRSPDGRLVFVDGTVEDISERKRAEDELAYLARHDPLTGIANRRALVESVERALAHAWRTGLTGALLLIDLDNFKVVNDRLGHSVGDAVLRSVATKLSRTLRRTEVLARLGGDEFAVLCFPVERPAALQVAQRVLRAIEEVSVTLPERVVRLAASCGVAMLPEHGNSAEELLVAADRALYAAKYRGGERVEIYRPEYWSSGEALGAQHVLALEAALAQERFLLFGQPILDLRQGRTAGVELLLRFRSEDGDPVPPSRYLPIAERLGLLPRIDRWVVQQAIRYARQHAGRVHVNLSPQTLRNFDVLDVFLQELREAPLSPGTLVFELTETAADAELASTWEHLAALRALGCAVAIDDFGVGYSSFHRLRSLPIDFLKIDGIFVVDLLDDPVSRRIVHSMVELADALGAETIAEWVEDERLLDVLRELGVDYAQGFAIGAPRPLEPS